MPLFDSTNSASSVPTFGGLSASLSDRLQPGLSLGSGLVSGLGATASKGLTADALSTRQHSFAQVLGREARTRLPNKEDQARETAEQFVASSLIEPILKQMRGSEQSPPPLGPSQGEKQFRSLMDAKVARDIVKRSHWDVVDRVASDLLKRSKGVSA